MSDSQAVLKFWFNDVNESPKKLEERNALWWRKKQETDDYIRHHFLELHQQACNNQLHHWTSSTKGTLALIILLDQFSRNLFRNTKKMYSQDSTALQLSLENINSNQHKELSLVERIFIYMPLEHSEDLSLQNRSVDLFQELYDSADKPLKEAFYGYVDYAIRHRDIVEKFGRFPHRNSILGRESTAEEIEFLKLPGSGF